MANKITGGRRERGREDGFVEIALLPRNKTNSSINNSVSREREGVYLWEDSLE